jgi:hypothetical protein
VFHQISIGKAALALGLLAGGWHILWAILVALGFAKPLIDFILWIHFIKPIYEIEPFEIARAATLVVLTAGLGAIVGAAFAAVWNALHPA